MFDVSSSKRAPAAATCKLINSSTQNYSNQKLRLKYPNYFTCCMNLTASILVDTRHHPLRHLNDSSDLQHRAPSSSHCRLEFVC